MQKERPLHVGSVAFHVIWPKSDSEHSLIGRSGVESIKPSSHPKENCLKLIRFTDPLRRVGGNGQTATAYLERLACVMRLGTF